MRVGDGKKPAQWDPAFFYLQFDICSSDDGAMEGHMRRALNLGHMKFVLRKRMIVSDATSNLGSSFSQALLYWEG